MKGPPLQRLESALRGLVMEVTVYLSFRKPLPKHARYVAMGAVSGEEASPDGQCAVATAVRHDPRDLLRMVERPGHDTLHALDALARLLVDVPEWDFLVPAPSEESPGHDLRSLRHRAWEGFAGEYVRDYLWLVEDPGKFDPGAARLLFQRMVDRIQLGRLRTLRITPLFGLWLAGRELILSPQVRLRPTHDFERHLWLNPDERYGRDSAPGRQALGLTSVIEVEEPRDDKRDGSMSRIIDLSTTQPGPCESAVLACLRLVSQSGDFSNGIRPGFMEQHVEGSRHEYQMRWPLVGSMGPQRHHPGVFQPSEEQRAQLVPLFERIHTLFTQERRSLTPGDRSLIVALNRWMSSYSRTDPKDWLIDCWIALEGLFTQRKEPGLTTKCATRVSQALAALGGGAAKELEAEVRASYDCRCDIVHGEREIRRDFFSIALRTRSHLGQILRHRLLSAPATPPLP
ncbi:hypothetical protein D7Y13_22130 [Corallococcus praedator]|uniref:Apea-like HEPN domain-containing protein n=2 Tax=Myxococcaceae TaxID=31 RepID=A0ABX9QGY9_9BACT|nr:hypothetical protein D7X75_23435 [Corallococcus sp. CA031C]RKI03409.1 hypothetical protein D7Y13_22130 [Corallococcus praedator]